MRLENTERLEKNDAARRLGFAKEDFSEKYVFMNPGNLYLSFSNKLIASKHEEVKKLERAVKRLKKDGVFDRIANSYTSTVMQ